MRTPSRPPALTGLVLVLALLVSSCGGGTDEPAASPSPTAPAETPETTPETPGTTDPVTPDEPAPGDGYLPVPDGVTLTAPGTRLKLKDAAVAAWLPRQDLVGVVDVAVTRIAETTVQASLASFDLDRDEQRSTPYFVTTKVTNVGETDLGARLLPVYFLDDRGVLVAPTGVARDFEQCPGSVLPAVFAPEDSATSCLIFLVPEGATLQSIVFSPPEGVVPLRWMGEVTSVQDETRTKRRRS